jgi:hypothetical protein
MSMTPAEAPMTLAEAKSTLRDIEKTENRAAASQLGRGAAPHLIVWGVVWTIGYLAGAIDVRTNWIWIPLTLSGVAASYLIDRRLNRGAIKGFSWRYAASFVAIGVFIAALFSILRPREYNQIAAFYPLVIGLYYAFMGIWTKGWRMLPLGAALIILTVVGYYFLPDHYLYWMAAVGGGGLILGGLWMRSV